ncbi:12215_t:CDS:2 [Ambispora gerdemannii]|uniref:12215_t:CDS:1 n=1 Tax=Ambispora gerdemannii TaxID=144530 RepID=A0A9N8WES8_9GLOM|nr:12215_t:CDS:2 [Ambispora gerdemannii]
MAPESLSGRGSYSQATDYYESAKAIVQKLPKTLRPFIKKCWHSDPTQRPTAEQILKLTNKNKKEAKPPHPGLFTQQTASFIRNVILVHFRIVFYGS